MMILRTARLLLAQINLNLDGSLLSRDHFNPAFSVQSIKTVVEETVDILRSQALSKNVKLKVDCDLKQEVCRFDRMRVQQILINLLTNAIKFSHERSMVFVTVMTIKASATEIDVKI